MFLKKEAARKDVGPRFDTRNGWKTFVELTKKLDWCTPMEWSKGEPKSELELCCIKWQRDAIEEAAQKGSAVRTYRKNWQSERVCLGTSADRAERTTVLVDVVWKLRSK